LKIEDLWYRSRSAGGCAACRSVFSIKIDRIPSIPKSLNPLIPQSDPCPIFMQDLGNKLFQMPLQLIKNNNIIDPAINLALEEYFLIIYHIPLVWKLSGLK